MTAVARDRLIERLIACTPEERARVIRGLGAPHKRELVERWWLWAHAGQIAPAGDWRVWMIRAGRGFGKTRAGAEWVSQYARDQPGARIALVGATLEDVRRVMVKGASGLLAVARADEAPMWHASSGEIEFPSGARAFVYSAAAAEKLRGPEHDAAWCDELAKWRGEEAWDNLMMTLRGREDARIVVTTTPKPVPLMRKVIRMRGLIETQGRTAENPHLPRSFVEAMTDEYAGTRLGRQELDGELIEDVEGALWTRETIERCRVDEAPGLVRVVIGVDPPVSVGGDACGIVAVGLGRDGTGYVIEDASVQGATPERWAQAVAACAARHGADRVIAEKNQGGDMVASTLKAADAGLPVTLVSASRGKSARAEPVSLLYEAGKVRHAGAWPGLEDELCGLVIGGGYDGPGRSPDRADALVWAVTALMLGKKREARVRVV
ncbi:terminase family protein [Sphingomonas sp. AOB5]|uniref:DNA-packaging protein n=1 Tax=Sphingomonas sp. AOB5 TaxID=3034017 RepID=UPI0023F9C698|nr:terminase family protein [Sphingomonas sp. AOB5]MDF7777400.1 terminase family protein [Sphingomonas sp. AOB5]